MNDRIFYADTPLSFIHDAGGLVTYINKHLYSNAHNMEDVVLLLCAYSVYMTYEELYLLYPVSTSNLKNKVMPGLISKGYMEKRRFEKPRGACSDYFFLTSRGYEAANALSMGRLSVTYLATRRKSSAITHSFYIGYSFFEMLKLPYSISWMREYSGNTGAFKSGSGRRRDALQIDGVCRFEYEAGRYGNIYIEEDTGYERTDVLVGKLEHYLQYGYFDGNNDILVFSCVDPNVNASSLKTKKKNPFSEKHVRQLLSYMTEHGIDDAYLCLSDKDYPSWDFLFEFLRLVGGLEGAPSSYKRGTFLIGTKFLKAYLFSIGIRQNPYLSNLMNREHLKVSMLRLVQLSGYALKNLNREEWVFPIVHGFPVLCIPTPLLEKRLSLYMGTGSFALKEMAAVSLKKFFNDISFVRRLSLPIRLSNDQEISLRNEFSYDSGDGKRGRLFIEMPFMDTGSLVRCFMLLKKRPLGELINIVCVFESYQQAGEFYSLLDYVYEEMYVVYDRPFGIFGILLKDLGQKAELFVMDDLSGYEEANTFAAAVSEKTLKSS